MDTKDYMTWVGKKFLFAAMTHTPPGQNAKDIPPIKIKGEITSAVQDEKSGATFLEINTRYIYLHGRAFPIVKQVITIEKGRKPYLYFDSCRVAGNECFAGEFVLVD
ncbi:MAG TPA: hypothetical protein VJ579_04290 [Candidatus Paceibacterota bacterium]|nr:hypothetical protein [Candidatus Paceibacterota bacterium]